MTDESGELGVTEFFDDPNAVALIARINREHGNIKAELEERLDLTDKPVKKLLDRAKDADLIVDSTIRPGDHARADRYELTERGKAVQALLRGMELDDLHRDYLGLRADWESSVSAVKAVVKGEGLHEERIQQDHWARTDYYVEEFERLQILEEIKQQAFSGDDDEDLGTVEVWGSESEE